MPIRDRVNHFPYPGIEIGDCGQKVGLNEMDNGWMKFNSYRVSKDALLDRFGKVDDEGNYSSDIKSEGKRFAITISCLTGGRVILS